jgi:hypothetical protein
VERHVTIPYTRTFPYSVEEAFAWLTDYTDEDAGLTDAVVLARPVREKRGDRVILDGTLSFLGVKQEGTVEVRLHPPDRWEATIVNGPGRGSVYAYRLTGTPSGGSRLDVAYRIRVKRLRGWLKLQIVKPFVRREIARMWGGFAASMARELAEGAGAGARDEASRESPRARGH